MKRHLLKRGKGWAFRVMVPLKLRGKFKATTGKPLAAIVEGLGTSDEKKAEQLAAKRHSHWLTVFERAKQDAPLTLAEIDAAAREAYRYLLDDMAAKPPDETSLDAALDHAAEALSEQNWPAVTADIKAVERRLGVTLEPETEPYATLAAAILRARLAALEGRQRLVQGHVTEPPTNFLGPQGIDAGTLKPVTLTPRAPRIRNERGPMALFEQWIGEAQPAASTVNRWRAVFLDLEGRFGKRDISEDDAREWAKELVTPERSAATVSEIWISAARTVYRWATEQKLANGNPFAMVKITVPEKATLRDKSFTDDEAATILKAASKIDPGDNAFKSAQRWAPWLAAYSGARMGELTQLRGQDIETRGGITAMRITPEAGSVKTKTFRLVPLHKHLIAMGFVKFVKARGKGPLFYNPEANGNGNSDATNPRRPRAVKTRERLAAWVRELGVTDKSLSPNHAWRHTFKQIAERAGISERMSDAITGHAPTTAGRGYGKPTVEDMAAALAKFPRYKV